MKVERLSFSKIKITLTNDEISLYDMDFEELCYDQDLALDFLNMLITDEGIDFLKGDCKLKIEMQKNKNFVFIITKLDSSYQKQSLVYKFNSIADAVMGCKRISMYFNGASSLYKYEGNYYISIKGVNDYVSQDCEVLMCDYGTKTKNGNEFEGDLAENGELLIKDEAVEVLCNYLNYEY